MTLRLYDTQTRTVRDFEPRVPGKVGLYICGLTTQGAPHIGHLRFTVAFDILRRWLEVGHGYEVTLVRNVTDIDDKILRKSAEAQPPVEWWAWSYANERATDAALQVLGVRPATYEPRATGHIPEMIEIIEQLIEAGHAYPAPDGSGDVYFDVQSWPSYGELTHQGIDDMEPATDADPRGKRDPRDFALWKGHKDGEPLTASWPTPWGRGRPGWHLECSAMARKYLGDEFDIHGGGIDLRFPHHENEIAQSKACGLGFARYWMHNAWLTAAGEKMSKSLGNGMSVAEVTKEHRPLALRWYMSSAHYRSTLEYSPDSLVEAEAALSRVEGFIDRAASETGNTDTAVRAEAIGDDFRAALDDDLNVATALAAIFAAVKRGNAALASGDKDAAVAERDAVVAMTHVLGVNPTDPQWAGGNSSGADDAAMAALDHLIQARAAARTQARADKDYATADAIRDELAAAGVTLTDTADGVRWSLNQERG